MVFELRSQRLINECKKHNARFLGNGIQDLGQLFWCSDKRIDVFDRAMAGVLRRGRARYSVEGFSGGVGDQVHVEISGVGALHGVLINCGKVSGSWLLIDSLACFGGVFHETSRDEPARQTAGISYSGRDTWINFDTYR